MWKGDGGGGMNGWSGCLMGKNRNECFGGMKEKLGNGIDGGAYVLQCVGAEHLCRLGRFVCPLIRISSTVYVALPLKNIPGSQFHFLCQFPSLLQTNPSPEFARWLFDGAIEGFPEVP